MAEPQWDHHTGDNNDRTEGREDRWGDERGDSTVDNLIHDDPSFFPSSDAAAGKDGSPGGSGNGVEAIPINGAATEQAAGEDEDGEVPVYDDPTGSMFAGELAVRTFRPVDHLIVMIFGSAHPILPDQVP